MKRLAASLFRAFIAFAALGAAATPGQALDHDHAEWLMVTATGPVQGRLRAYAEFQPRFGEDGQDGDFDLRSLLLRGALGWEVCKGWTLWAGYGYTPVYDPDRGENRIFQQSTYDWTMGPFKAQHRARLEQRFLEHEADVSWRLRNQLRVLYPIPGFEKWALVLADELFLNLDSVTSGPRSGYDQNRAFAGVSVQVTPWLRVEMDYLNQSINRQPHKRDSLVNGVVTQAAFTW